ncbi:MULTISPECIES: VOC family protein [Alphaproteobacteria]|uniref:VOC family protein n=1 Tax=Alphaproteobacteria TaxID=28211 RepID=UPI0030EE3FB7|tara:strand:+ start:61883 stop:62308 length:426 start_codon:yes stop_codon:yes gene_type:complete
MDDNISANWHFHHLGYAVASVSNELAYFQQLGYRQEGKQFSDPTQGIKGCFITGGGPRIELLENLQGFDTLTPWLRNGIKFYHTAYEVPDIHQAIAETVRQKAKIITSPVPAVAFNQRLIAFVMLRNRLLVEFIHKPSDNA